LRHAILRTFTSAPSGRLQLPVADRFQKLELNTVRVGSEAIPIGNRGTTAAERIRGELFRLGGTAAKRTIQQPILVARPPGDGRRWRTFLRHPTI
jgi:hypothetical protein